MASYVTKEVGGCGVLSKCMRRVRWRIEQRLITLLEGDMKENVTSLCQKVRANLLEDILSITELAKAKVSGFDEVEAARIHKLVDASVMGPFSEKISAEVEKYSQEEQEAIREDLREEYVDMLLENYASALKNVRTRWGNNNAANDKLREEVSESIDDFLKVCTKQHMIFIVEAKILQGVASDLTNHAASLMLAAKNTSSDGAEISEPSSELRTIMLKVMDKMLRMLGAELLTMTRIFRDIVITREVASQKRDSEGSSKTQYSEDGLDVLFSQCRMLVADNLASLIKNTYSSALGNRDSLSDRPASEGETAKLRSTIERALIEGLLKEFKNAMIESLYTLKVVSVTRHMVNRTLPKEVDLVIESCFPRDIGGGVWLCRVGEYPTVLVDRFKEAVLNCLSEELPCQT